MSSGNYSNDRRYRLPKLGWVKNDLYVKQYSLGNTRGRVEGYARPGIRNEKMGHIRSADVVTEFAATTGWGCWIRISCELHPAEQVARVMRIDVDQAPMKGNTKEVLVALKNDAVPEDLLCSYAGCTAQPSIVLSLL